MIEAGLSQVEVAREFNISRAAVSQVVAGTRVSSRVMNFIARALGVSIAKLWPPNKEAA